MDKNNPRRKVTDKLNHAIETLVGIVAFLSLGDKR
jgi:hypothetical protein